MIYETPEKYYYRLHHIRPRFKNDLENVLIFVASEISKMGRKPSADFRAELNDRIRMYPGNAVRKEKTINNWRTEISALFGLIEFDSKTNESWPGSMAVKLAEEQDLVRFFKYFLYHFQYPGGHLKPRESYQLIKNGVCFKPAYFVLSLLKTGEEITKERFFVTKAELTHCVFNDLRVTKGDMSVSEVVRLIVENRRTAVEYDWSGDVVRYAGDILDYMVTANLLVIHGSKYFINWQEREAVTAFLTKPLFYKGYDQYYSKKGFGIKDVAGEQDGWFGYVNTDLKEDLFKTDVLKYLGIEGARIPQPQWIPLPKELPEEGQKKRTKEIGDLGEGLAYGHECMRLKIGKREDLIRLVKRVPSALALGYDIQSAEFDERKRYVEVKTSISSKSINFYSFHLTPNEWGTADSVGERYFVYRLIISKNSVKLFIIQDPVGKYKTSGVRMVPRNGADLICNEGSGRWENFLIWQE